ncbi:AIPR family protein [Paenibacillus sp. MABNR03]|uniref:AIPR family protein n=1 Tax=Paenibacillus sp. MABNR03 TaxID=3142626 RepID=UPI003D2E2F0D
MSMFHVGVIRKYLLETFDGLIDLEDYKTKSAEEREDAFLTRALAAYTIMALSETTPEEAANAVTDGYKDNGIDAIYFNSKEKILYLIQTKWKKDGTGSVVRGDFQKFQQGIKDLTFPRFHRFNEKIQNRQPEIEAALTDAGTKFMILLVYTGQESISEDIIEDSNSFLEELNDASEFASFKSLKQSSIYNMIAKGAQGQPINLDIALSNWGNVEEPYKAYYGQVAASDVAVWWEEHYPQLFAPNIRMFLGDTDVNNSIIKTLKDEPQNFWYYNNGITALCSTIKKKPIGGNTRDAGIFEVVDMVIVNGAQTVGSIASAARTAAEKVELARVPIRFISVKDSPEHFAKNVTRNTNTQNRIEKRDFLALDPEQDRIKDQLNLHQVSYVYKSGETGNGNVNSFDILEATVARACYQEDIDLTVQAKREIGKLWDDITKAPYKILFNPSVDAIQLWKLVQVLRVVENDLSQKQLAWTGREKLYAYHGNRFVIHLVYREVEEIIKSSNMILTDEDIENIKIATDSTISKLMDIVEGEYSDSLLASLFKNLTKCKAIHKKFFPSKIVRKAIKIPQ